MSDLPAFIAARLDEDEAVARAATPGPWEVGNRWHVQGASHCRCNAGPLVWEGEREINGSRIHSHVHRRDQPYEGDSDVVQAVADKGKPRHVTFGNDYGSGVGPEDAAHVARHDPARVLADVAAKRAIAKMHSIHHRSAEFGREECEQCSFHEAYEGFNDHSEPWPCTTLRYLASIWSDHPDFDPAWRL